VTGEAIKAMAPGSVLVDMGASALGGNVEGSVPGETIVADNGITIIGADKLPSSMAAAASSMYSRNISSLLTYMSDDGQFAVDLGDELVAGVVISHEGKVVHPALSGQGDAPANTAAAPPAPTE
jgi:NAD(P) transhydrogenase subunit alpha